MRPALQHFAWPALLIGGLVLLPIVPATAADGPAKPKVKAKAKTSRSAKLPTEAQIPAVNLLTALRNGEISVHAEGIGDGRMTVSITNLSHRQLRVVLPPGLIASGATGQFGGMGGGGMGGMGGGMGGMGGGMGGMGGGMGGMGGMMSVPPQVPARSSVR
jgi:hypothetical protein